MKSLKRLFVAVVAASMVLTSVATGFAAPFTDVSGQKFEQSVSKLQQLGVFVGKGDGTFGYSEKVTRAEMAAILVKLAGYANEVATAKNSDAAFADVANHWSKGEVNVAYQHGLVSGVGNGNFNPDGNVTYGEVITMVMKLLGYGPVVDGKGVWPYNYINKSSQTGIELYKDVAISATAAATRSDIAKIADNALTADVLYESGYSENGNPEYASSGTDTKYELLYKVFEAFTFKKEVVDQVPAMSISGNDDNKINLIKKELIVKDTDATLLGKVKLADGIVEDANTLLHLEVSGIYKYDEENSENVILSIVPDTKSSNVIKDTVKKITMDSNGEVKTIEFVKAGKKDVKTDAALVLDYTTVSDSDIKTQLLNGEDLINDTITATAVLNSDGIIAYVNLWVNKEMVFGDSYIYTGIIRDASSSELKIMKNVIGKADQTTSIYFKDVQEGISKNGVQATVIRDGKAAKFADFKKGDQITFIEKGTKTKYGTHEVRPNYYVVANSAKAISGKKADSILGTSKANLKIVVDGVTYKAASNLVYNKKTSSDITGGSYMVIEDNPATSEVDEGNVDELSDFLIDAANFALNSNGDIAYIESVESIASANEATSLIVETESKNVDGENRLEVTLLKKDGNFATLVTSDPVSSADRDAKYTVGKLLKYKITRKGELDTASISTYATSEITVDADGSQINTNTVNKDTAFFCLAENRADYTDEEWDDMSYSDKYQTTTWETMSDIYDNANPTLPAGSIIYNKDGFVKAVFINGMMENEDVQEGLIVATGLNADGVFVKLFIDGNERQYKLAGGANYATNGNYVYAVASGTSVTLSGNGDEYAAATGGSTDKKIYRAKNDAGDGNSFTYRRIYLNSINEPSEDGTTRSLSFVDGVKVYDASDKNAVTKITISDIKNGDYFYCIKNDEGKLTVIVKINKSDLHKETSLNTNS